MTSIIDDDINVIIFGEEGVITNAMVEYLPLSMSIVIQKMGRRAEAAWLGEMMLPGGRHNDDDDGSLKLKNNNRQTMVFRFHAVGNEGANEEGCEKRG